jgi:hypothetical protein
VNGFMVNQVVQRNPIWFFMGEGAQQAFFRGHFWHIVLL